MRCEIVCADALVWLSGREPGGSIITSLPDADEVGVSPVEHAPWFRLAARACMAAIGTKGVAVFYQTDRKHDGALMSKAGILLAEAEYEGLHLLWHKIVLRRGIGKVDLHRPGYSHLIAFGRQRKPGQATPDVLEPARLGYENGMPLEATRLAVDFVSRSGNLVIDPFCGRGTVLAVVCDYGLDAIGVDIDLAQCDRAREAVARWR